MNFTIISLALSSLHSLSPLHAGQRYSIMKSSFKNFYSPILFLNQDYLSIEKSTFTHGVGSLIYVDNSDDIEEIKEGTYDSNNKPDLSFNNIQNKKLIIIRNCNFNEINSDQYLINLNSELLTFYMTSCTFHNGYFKKGLQYLRSRATTISHICFSYSGNCDHEDGLFIKTNTPSYSFFKMIYSTIVGVGQKLDAKSVLYLQTPSSLRFQCMNISHFGINYADDDIIASLKIVSPFCLNMLMNTFYKLDSNQIFNFNPQDGDKQYDHYIGMCNFYDNNYAGLIRIDSNHHAQVCIDDCVFKNNEVNCHDKYFVFPPNPIFGLQIINCIFDVAFDRSNFPNDFYEANNIVRESPISKKLAHFIVEKICLGVENNDAFGCQNGTCPGDKGCADDAFNFKPDDVSYTEMYHPDIDTPTPVPTNYFSSSADFSFSKQFTTSFAFSKSEYFSGSFFFTKTGVFSETTGFTKTGEFSKTDAFSETHDFTQSRKFTASDNLDRTHFFTKSEKFSKSSQFSSSKEFEPTSEFTLSQSFLPSNSFSLSKRFTPSNVFSDSLHFTSSNDFSKSGTFAPVVIIDRDESNTGGKLKPGAIAGKIGRAHV